MKVSFPLPVKTIRFQAEGVRVYAPAVSGLTDSNVQNKINQTIEMQTKTLMNEQGYPKQASNLEMTGSYEIKTNQRAVLSLCLRNYAYIQGHAHGLTIIRSLTANTATGRFYLLHELFKPGSEYVTKISELIRIQIKERELPLLEPFAGIWPDQEFYISDKALVIYFQAYEITPYYVGLPMFPIPVYTLHNLIEEKSPLGAMLAE
ncbi:DUF3298 and DUF4163 domain-containing protein [Paenibacillus larvae]|uniref:DUF3298 and DUF4163 domain-containing protein n=1 Tax=Paenibacillus larvae TaxID=1464 RepID=UPI00227E6103|nr:DUF3298 and DUF4163 domain-containing protein [Paenibacillus larvae]MCY9510408.1 DUF3298 and DUF4163 domain-containing protein [Paenibacillus larvae]MCY9526704.1 DUF3298 and DUF4163 domain-containing protein [Paenibacillus larvae]